MCRLSYKWQFKVIVTKVLFKCELESFLFQNKKEQWRDGKNEVFIANYMFLTQKTTVLIGSTGSMCEGTFFVWLQVNVRKMDQIMKTKVTTVKKVINNSLCPRNDDWPLLKILGSVWIETSLLTTLHKYCCNDIK